MNIANYSTKVFARGLSALLTFGFLAGAVAGEAPVFQHTLEYQPPEPYEVVIHYDGELAEEDRELGNRLEAAGRGEGRHANISVGWRDHSAMRHSNPEYKSLPRMELRYPSATGIRGTLWEGPLEEEALEGMLRSPVRERIAEKLIDRQAGVWVLLQSGNRSEDVRAQRFLEEELSKLEANLEVSDPGEESGVDAGEIHSDIDFSIIVLDRDDPDEQILIKMLLGIERDLVEYKDKPLVFPIYGRGVVMYALVGDGINEWTLNSAGEFLTGPCSSCLIGASGSDLHLLMSVDWESRVEQLSNYENAERRYGRDH